MSNYLLLAILVGAVACGGPIDEQLELEAFAELEERDEPLPAAGLDRDFEEIARASEFRGLVSRVALVDAADCPARIHSEDTVPWRCLEVLSGRHSLLGDVDVIDGERHVRFHTLRSLLSPAERNAESFGCPPNRQPNGQVDLHTAGVRKFVAAGYFVPGSGGPRRYEVLFRRKDDGTYRLLPARAKLDVGEWRPIKPGLGACVGPQG